MRIIAIQECCSGNASVGHMWLETRSFDETTPVNKIIEWGRDVVAPSSSKGKLIITVDGGTIE